jgi:cellobiose phosphorylase
MQAVEQHLVNREARIVLLFAPPFYSAPVDPGYIKGYLPGLRENGGQYTHAAIWVLMAQAMLRNHEAVGELLKILSPLRHSTSTDEARLYRVEPYVVAADVYAGDKLAGRGGWTWYTGAAAWFYRVVLEQVVGIRIVGDTLRIDPCIPKDWPDFEVALKQPMLDYLVQVSRGTAASISVDGEPLAGESVTLLRDQRRHVVRVTLV